MHLYRQSLHYLRIFVDILVLLISFLIAGYFSPEANLMLLKTKLLFLFLSLILIWIFSSNVFDLYEDYRARHFSFELVIVLKNIIVQAVASILILFLIKEPAFSRTFIFLYIALISFLLIIEKYTFNRFLQFVRRHGRNLRSILIIGAGEVGKSFHNSIMKNPHFGYRLIGFLDDCSKSQLDGNYLGTIDELDDVLTKNGVDDVIIALPNYAMERIERVINTCERYTTRVQIIPNYFRFLSPRYQVSMFGKFPIISVREDRINEFHWRLLKRGFDTGFTLLLFVFLFSWLWLIIALIIKLESKGPIFFKQERWGRNNRRIICYKFRSMRSDSNDIDENGKYLQACKNDPRITKFGSFIRKTNIDELPQFINVLKGEISIVGPRPHPTPLNLESKDHIRKYMLRHLVKPGITGWAQVKGFRGETRDPILMQKRVEHDIWYIENWSFLLDIQIIILTIWRMLKGDRHAY